MTMTQFWLSDLVAGIEFWSINIVETYASILESVWDGIWRAQPSVWYNRVSRFNNRTICILRSGSQSYRP